MAVLGGTGDEGYGLALRWGLSGYEVIIGSRSVDRAKAAAENIAKTIGLRTNVSGLANEEAVLKADVIVLSVPFAGLNDTLKSINPSLRPGQVVVNVTVPLETAIGGRATRTLGVWAGSAGELAAAMAPKGVKVVSAFNNVSAELLNDLKRDVDCDVMVCGDDEDAKRLVMDMVRTIPGARGIDAGPLENSRTVEMLTALLVGINARYGVKNAGVRITGIKPAP